MKKKLAIVSAFVTSAFCLLPFALLAQTAPPATEVFLAPLTWANASLTIGAPVNISNNPGYDNQPSFFTDSSAVLFASNRDTKQNDIYKYDIASKQLVQLTKTAENEYSPLVALDGKSFLCVHGTEQSIFRYDMDGSNPRVKTFRPEHADQWEYGVKTNLFSDKLAATLSVYDIKVSDRVMPNPANIRDYTQGGKVGSKGFEIDVTANPVTGLNLIAGFSHNKTKVISGDPEDFYSEPGRAIGGQGPQKLANVWATYRISSGTLKNAGFGFGGNYAGEYKVIDNSKTGVFTLPAYTLLNASVFYNASHFRISLNVNNLTSKEYYIGYWSVNPQKPRNSTLSVAYKF